MSKPNRPTKSFVGCLMVVFPGSVDCTDLLTLEKCQYQQQCAVFICRDFAKRVGKAVRSHLLS
jgi:hypothetical protein